MSERERARKVDRDREKVGGKKGENERMEERERVWREERGRELLKGREREQKVEEDFPGAAAGCV